MRAPLMIVGIAGVFGLNTACTEALGYGDGILASATRGVVIDDAGTDANAGMDTGNTCFIDPKSGWMGTERDYPGYQDEVDDIGRFFGTDTILVTSGRGLHLGPADPSSYDLGGDYVVEGVVEAALAGEDIGVVAWQGDRCVAGWVVANDAVDIDDSACASEHLAIDPELADLYVGTDAGIVRVPYLSEGAVTDGSAVVDAEADLVVFDGFTGLLYTAEKGGTWVRAIDGAGNAVWTTDLGSPVIAVDDLGWREGAAALVHAGGVDQVFTLDAWTGEATLADETPEGATGLVTSRNGRHFALVGDSQVAFRQFARHDRD